MLPIVALTLVALPILLFNSWALRRAYRKVRRTIPGFPNPGVADPPRLYLVGTPHPHGPPRHAPISGRPCVAWRVTVVWRHPLLGTVLRRHDRYSDADFTLDCSDTKVRVSLLPGEDSALPAQAFADASPPWVMPRDQAPHLDFVIRVVDDEALLPKLHRLPNEQAKRAEQAALAECSRYTPTPREKDAALYVTETILDTEHEWVCDGEPDSSTAALNISSSRQTIETIDTFIPTKLALESSLHDARRKTTLNELSPIAICDAILIIPALVGIILAFI